MKLTAGDWQGIAEGWAVAHVKRTTQVIFIPWID